MLINYLIKAYKGKFIWSRLKKKYGTGRMPSKYILFPEEDIRYNAWALCFMEYYINKIKLDKVIVLTMGQSVIDAIENVNHSNMHVIKLSKKSMECLIRYSALVPRNEEWTIVSVKKPYDTGAERLIGKKGISEKEIVWYDVYRMSKEIDNKLIEKIRKWKNADEVKNYIIKVER